MMRLMSENDIGEIREELEAYKKQLDSLQEELKLLIKHAPTAHNDIIATANQQGHQGGDQAEVERCREFLKKYDIRVGWDLLQIGASNSVAYT
jgi:F0F1-type ATP synthase membrane subunit b/b'